MYIIFDKEDIRDFKSKGFVPIINKSTNEDGGDNRIYHGYTCYKYNMNDIRNFEIGEITDEEKELIRNHRLLNNPDRRSGVFIGGYELITEDIKEEDTLKRMRENQKVTIKNDNVFCLDGKEEIYFGLKDAVKILRILNGGDDYYAFLSCGKCYNHESYDHSDFISSNYDENMEISDKNKLKEWLEKWLLKLGLRESLFR
jgi:hypothetical protein